MGLWDDDLPEPDEPLSFSESESEVMEVQSRVPKSDELSLGYAEVQDGNRKVWRLIGVPQSDRLSHFYIIGASGMGKTKFLEHLIWQDIKNRVGFGIIDPHGDLIARVKELLVFVVGLDEGLEERVVLIDPTDKENTVCFNPLELTEGYTPARQAGELVEVFQRIWSDAWGDRMADIFRNTLIALIENNLTLDEVPTFLTDAAFRVKLLPNVKNDKCRDYFNNEFNILNAKTRSEWITSTLNKVRTFLADDTVRDIFLSPKSSFNFREVMDSGKILLVRLPKGLLGTSSDLLGSLILSKIQMAAFSRADMPEEKRRPFYLYIDEFQNFAAENFAQVLDEARKYKLALTLAHQNLGQVPAKLKSSLLNCPLQAYFRVSRVDAEILAKELFVGIGGSQQSWEPYFQELQILRSRGCYIKNKNGGAIALITTHPADGIERYYEEVIKDESKISIMKGVYWDRESHIGESYLRSREDIEREYRARMHALLDGNVSEVFKERKRGAIHSVNYKKIIEEGENNQVEFKESLRGDNEKSGGRPNKTMEYFVAKAIAAFMNSEGGTLFIGVHDKGEILGIENDYTPFNKGKDGFLLYLDQTINKFLGKEFNQFTDVKIMPIDGKEVCVIEVAASKMPAYVKSKESEEFYIRAAASSPPMGVREATEYIKIHFSDKV
jgi:Putative DNA-binding domain/Type IV secretion-system coupling protein DNA-binding domain